MSNTIIQGDCLEVMKGFKDNEFDLVITDPPYGIGIAKAGKVGGGSVRGKTKKFKPSSWDEFTPSQAYFDEIRRVSTNQIIFGGNYFANKLSNSRCWLVWFKRDGLPTRTFADAELAWTSFDSNTRVFSLRWDGFIRDSKNDRFNHPTQKPTELLKWCIAQFKLEGQTILDPFMGTGSTLIAAQEMGCDCTGIEINQEYIDIASNRTKQGVLL